MIVINLTCTTCRNTYTQGKNLHPGSDCPGCVEHNRMLPIDVRNSEDMAVIGKLITGTPVFENSEWANSTLCSVGTPHEPHTWFEEVPGDQNDSQRYICPGRNLDNTERAFYVLLTQGERGLKVAGISRVAKPLMDTLDGWHNQGRECWLLTLTDQSAGLPGAKLEAIVPTHEFSTVFLTSDVPSGDLDA